MKNYKTFEQIAKLWQVDKNQYVKKSTSAAYSLLIVNHLLPAFGRMDDITDWNAQMLKLR